MAVLVDGHQKAGHSKGALYLNGTDLSIMLDLLHARRLFNAGLIKAANSKPKRVAIAT